MCDRDDYDGVDGDVVKESCGDVHERCQWYIMGESVRGRWLIGLILS